MADNYSYLLARHPQVLAKVREEIQAIVGDDAHLKREDLKRMTYLSNVLKESKVA